MKSVIEGFFLFFPSILQVVGRQVVKFQFWGESFPYGSSWQIIQLLQNFKKKQNKCLTLPRGFEEKISGLEPNVCSRD